MRSRPKLQKRTIRRRLAAANLRLKQEQDHFKKTIEDLQERCPHDWAYQGDPAGGSDSNYHCWICGGFCRSLPDE